MRNTFITCRSKSSRCLKSISPSQISLGLFFKGNLTFGSVIGGIIMIFMFTGLFIYSIVQLMQIIDGSANNIDLSLRSLDITVDTQHFRASEFLSKLTHIYPSAIYNGSQNDSYWQNTKISLQLVKGALPLDDVIYHMDFLSSEDIYVNHSLCQILKYNFSFSNNETLQKSLTAYNEEGFLGYEKEFNYFYTSFGILISNQNKDMNMTFFRLDIEYDKAKLQNTDVIERRQSNALGLEENYNSQHIKISIIIQNKTEDLFGINSKYEDKVFISEMIPLQTLQIPNVKQNYYNIMFMIDDQIIFLRETQFTLLQAFSKIGGLFAFIRIFTGLLRYFHQYQLRNHLKVLVESASQQPEEMDHLNFNERNGSYLKLNKSCITVENQENASLIADHKINDGKDMNEKEQYKHILSYESYLKLQQDFIKLKLELDAVKLRLEQVERVKKNE